MLQYSKSLDKLRQDLSLLEEKNLTIFEKLEKSIELIKTEKNNLIKEVRKNGFHSIEDEIHFFKHIKPAILSLFIVHSTCLAIETIRSTYSKKDIKLLIKKKLNFIQAHFIDFPEFVAYINSQSTKRDSFYFLRNSNSKPLIFTLPLDTDISTGYDIIAANAIAFKDLNDYFQKSTSVIQKDQLLTNIHWTAPKVALAELIYALHESGSVTLDKNDLIELSRTLGKVFNTEMPDIYRMFSEIRARKKDRCRFLIQLTKVLHTKMDQMDEPKPPN